MMSDRDPVDVLAEEFAARYRRGERPSVEEYARRHPELADRVRRVFPALALMENLAASEFAPQTGAAGTLAPSLQLCGSQLGDFRILRELGRGGMGVVYEAEQTSLGRHVALKVLPRQIWHDPKQYKRFEREMRATAQLHHTNIVPVFGMGEHEGTHFYAMQFIEGLSLAEVLEQLRNDPTSGSSGSRHSDELSRSYVAAVESAGAATRRGFELPPSAASPLPKARSEDTGMLPDSQSLPESSNEIVEPWDVSQGASTNDTSTARLSDTSTFSAQAVLQGVDPTSQGPASYWKTVARIGMQVADALDHAHSQGIAHRDIKPGNVLIDTRGCAWVTDFGLAKSEDQEDLTNTGDVIGTLRYMAPETLDGHADAQSDLYSLGATLYELLALRPPFEETERNALMRQVAQATPPRLRTLNPQIPRDLETIVAKAMERESARRYLSGAELADDLHRFLNDEPIRARRARPAERLWRWCRRNPGISWTAAVSLILLTTTVSGAFWLVTGERDRAVRLATEMERQAGQLAFLAKQERQARLEQQQAKDQVQAALNREAEWRRNEQELRQIAEEARDRAAEAAQEAETVTSFLMLEMYGAVGSGRSRGQELTVRSLLDWSAQRADAVLSSQPLQEAAVRDALGQAYQRLGLYEKAHQQLATALEIRRCLLGSDHASTLTTMNALALVLYHQGKYVESRSLAAEALPLLQQTKGREDPVTLLTMNTLAMSLHGLHRFSESQQLCEQALGAQRRVLGPEHVETLATMNTLAMALHSQKDFAGAQQILAESLDVLQRLYGPEHPNTLSAMANLAASIYGQGDYTGAETAYTDCWNLMKRVLGPDHPTTLAIQENVAVTMMFQKKFDQAEPLLRDALGLRRQTEGPAHWRTANTASQLAACLTQQKRYSDAEPLLLESYQTLTANVDTPPDFVRLTLRRLVILYRAWNKTDELNRWRTQLMQFNGRTRNNATGLQPPNANKQQ